LAHTSKPLVTRKILAQLLELGGAIAPIARQFYGYNSATRTHIWSKWRELWPKR